MDRIAKLCSYLPPCKTFADVGCDHGYCTQYMLKNGLCERAIIADVSAKCLGKAEQLLKEYIDCGICSSVCCNGLEKINSADLVLIAGMGGEEIISILKNSYIPAEFVLQPMRNVKEVRQFLIDWGAEITCDDVFESDGKFYFVICGKAVGDSRYTPAQLEFGKGSLNGALGSYLRGEIAKKRSYLERNLSDNARAQIEEEIKFTEGVLKGEIK